MRQLNLFDLLLALPLLMLMAVTSASANPKLGYVVHTVDGTFEIVRDDLKDAIVNRGFVIDYVGHFNKMLTRTSKAVGSVTAAGKKSPYKNAQYMQFCPSKLTHEAVSVSPFNIANCPVVLFVFELNYKPGKINVGYRLPMSGPSRLSKKIASDLRALLEQMAVEATQN